MLPDRARVLLDKIIEEIRPGEWKASGPAFATPRLRPYLPGLSHIGGLCRACWQGSGVLLRLILGGVRRGISAGGKAAWRGDTAPDRWESLGVAALVGIAAVPVAAGIGAVAVYFATPYARQILMTGSAAWLVAAVVLAPRTAWAKPAPETIIEDDEGDEPDAPTGDGIAVAVRQIANEHGWKGAHLDDIAADLGVTKPDLLTVLAEAGIPVTEQLKLTLPGGRQRNRQGVRLSALPAGLGEAPAGAAGTPVQHPPGHPTGHPTEPLPDRSPVTVHGGG